MYIVVGETLSPNLRCGALENAWSPVQGSGDVVITDPIRASRRWLGMRVERNDNYDDATRTAGNSMSLGGGMTKQDEGPALPTSYQAVNSSESTYDG